MAKIKDPEYSPMLVSRCETPDNPELNEFFFQSGILDHVKTDIQKECTNGKMIGHFQRKKVMHSISKEATKSIVAHTL